MAVEYSTANRLIGQPEHDGILEELTGIERNRFYRANEVFKILDNPIDQRCTTEQTGLRRLYRESSIDY